MNESDLLANIWESMKDYLTSGSTNDAALALVTAFLNQGIELSELEEASDECPVLERTIAALRDTDDDEEEDEEGY